MASGKTGFNIKNTSIYLTGGSTGAVGVKPDVKISDLLEAANKDEDDGFGGKAKKKQATGSEFEILNVVVLLKLTTDNDDEKSKSFASKCSIDASKSRLCVFLN